MLLQIFLIFVLTFRIECFQDKKYYSFAELSHASNGLIRSHSRNKLQNSAQLLKNRKQTASSSLHPFLENLNLLTGLNPDSSGGGNGLLSSLTSRSEPQASPPTKKSLNLLNGSPLNSDLVAKKLELQNGLEELEEEEEENPLKLLQLIGEKLRNLILRYSTVLSQSMNILVVPLGKKRSSEDSSRIKGIHDSLLGHSNTACAAQIKEEDDNRPEEVLSPGKLEVILRTMTPEERLSFDEKQSEVLELEQKKIESEIELFLKKRRERNAQKVANKGFEKEKPHNHHPEEDKKQEKKETRDKQVGKKREKEEKEEEEEEEEEEQDEEEEDQEH